MVIRALESVWGSSEESECASLLDWDFIVWVMYHSHHVVNVLMEILFNLCLIAEFLLCWGQWERVKEMFYICLCCWILYPPMCFSPLAVSLHHWPLHAAPVGSLEILQPLLGVEWINALWAVAKLSVAWHKSGTQENAEILEHIWALYTCVTI